MFPERTRTLLPKFLRSSLERDLERVHHFGFAHISPPLQANPHLILEHPYFYAVHTAAIHNPTQNYAVGLFVHQELEKRLAGVALQGYWNIIGSDGAVTKSDPKLPYLIFLGPKPQTTTTGLFLSATMPNLVTGDLSLSDALYGLIAMEGPAFFYEAPGWKIPTLKEMGKFLSRESHKLADCFLVGGNFLSISPEKEIIYDEDMAMVAGIFFDKNESMRAYTQDMKLALRHEIQRRFGDVPVEPQPGGDFYIPSGTPYLIQDATAGVVDALHNDSTLLDDVENAREAIRNGVPVVVSVSGVLKAAPPTPTDTSHGYSLMGLLTEHNQNYNKNYKPEKTLVSLLYSLTNKNNDQKLEYLIGSKYKQIKYETVYHSQYN